MGTSQQSIGLLLFFVVYFPPLYCGVVKRSDDASLEGLQTLVQQQAAAISSLQASLASLQSGHFALQSEVTMLESKVGTLSRSAAFTAMFSYDEYQDGIALSSHSTLKFDRVVANAGNGYDPLTGLFTAPVSGHYAFSLVMMVPERSSHPSLSLAIVRQGEVLDKAWAEKNSNFGQQGSTLSVAHVAAGERVWVQQDQGDAVRGAFLTVFSGFLVHAD